MRMRKEPPLHCDAKREAMVQKSLFFFAAHSSPVNTAILLTNSLPGVLSDGVLVFLCFSTFLNKAEKLGGRPAIIQGKSDTDTGKFGLCLLTKEAPQPVRSLSVVKRSIRPNAEWPGRKLVRTRGHRHCQNA